MRRYLFKNKIWFWAYAITMIINSIVITYSAFLIERIVNCATNVEVILLKRQIVYSIIYILVLFTIEYIRRTCRAIYLKRSVFDLKKDLFDNLIDQDLVTFSKENSAKYISILNNDVKMVEDNYFDNIFVIIRSVTMLATAVIFMICINIYVGVIAILLSVIPILIPMIFGKKLSKLKNGYSKALEVYNIKIKDIFTGFEVIKSFNIEKNIKENHIKINANTEEKKYKSYYAEGIVNAISNSVACSIVIIIFIVSVYFVIKGMITFSLMVAVTQLSGNITSPIFSMIEAFNKAKAVGDINNKLINLMSKNDQKDNGIDINEFNDKIEIRNLTYSFDNNRNILENINLDLHKGKKYAIVGGSGSGKSTLIKLILGYYNNYNGNIYIDGIDNRKIKRKSIFNICSIIHQNVFMFDDTMKNNITLYNNYSDKVVETSIEKAGLNDLINKLDGGINAKINENGNNFSGGEKQRIAIARAFVKGSNMLILDEATSSLDNETAYNIEDSLLNIKDITCLVVTHRYNSEILRRYDKIIVIKDGKLCETGTFDELMDKKNYFYSLYNIAN
ncbi:MAG: ABC transporter ATP-binding protein [Clostridium sp.]